MPLKVEESEMTDEQIIDQYTAEEREMLAEMIHDSSLYEKLVNSIAPTVFGSLESCTAEKCPVLSNNDRP